MKKFSKILSVALLVALVLSLGVANAFAVDITVHRDDTYATGAEGDRTYTWYRVFTAVKNGTYTAEGGGYDDDGTPGNVTAKDGSTATAFAYTASLNVANILGTYNSATNTWTAANNQTWFELTPIAGSNPQTFSVKWVGANTTTDTAQAAAQWLFSHQCWDASGSLVGDKDNVEGENSTSWTANGLPEGYYLLKGSEGQNLIAATTNIDINEKNSYPTIDKTQKDTADGTYTNDPVSVKVGDTIYYQVEVKVPADANQDITVTDTPSKGLTYSGSVVVTVGDTVAAAAAINNDGNVNYKEETAGTGEAWKYTIHATNATKGKYVVFTFSAIVNNEALVQTDRKNDVELVYGNYHQKDTVEHDIGADAIIKYDGATADLDNTTNALTAKSGKTIKYLEATFTLTDASGNAVNVKEATSGTKGVYVVATDATTNTVTSDKNHNGVILIYGLDPDVTYTLTETATETGYNLMNGTAELKPVKMDNNGNANKVTVAEAAGIYAGSSDDNAVTFELNAKAVSKVANNSGTVLPSTGGIGTTIFYVVGGVLVLAAIILLVTKKRMSE